MLNEDLVAAEPDLGGDVVKLRLPHQRVDQEPVHQLQGTLLDVLVGPVDGVPGLEPHHGPPAPLLENGPGFKGIEFIGLEALEQRRPSEKAHLPSQKGIAPPVKILDAGVLLLVGPVDVPRLFFLVVAEFLLKQEEADHLPRGGEEGHLLAFAETLCFLRGDGQRDGEGPREARCKTHLVKDPLVLFPPHEPLQGTEGPDGQKLQV